MGTGVVDFRWNETEISDRSAQLQTELSQMLSRIMGQEVEFAPERVNFEMELAHEGVDGTQTFIDLDRESAGTRRLLVLLNHVYHALDEGSLVILDEMDASLHTQVCEAILSLFLSPETNRKGAQLIATTHDTNLLRSPKLRRDQIWFTEKDREGATNLYPLSDISTKRSDNLEKGYLQGRFGAVPFAGHISDVGE